MLNNKGIFVISLDFELHWGCFESMELNQAQQKYFQNTREVIPKMLQEFSSNEISVTWATVGMLFNKNKTDWENNIPALLPTYQDEKVSSYNWINKNGFIDEDDFCHFASNIVDAIKATPYQELATHTYSHYYCLEEGQTLEQFGADMKKASDVGEERDAKMQSLVFPRNQFNEEYLTVCKKLGITSVRSNPNIWYWKASAKSTLLRKIFRSLDAYVKLITPSLFFLKDINVDKNLPILLPASRLYRPWKPRFTIQNKLKMKRILNEMTQAAKQKAYYHLWWHPHNFGNHPKECMDELQQIIQHYKYLNNKYGFTSLSMCETADLLTQANQHA